MKATNRAKLRQLAAAKRLTETVEHYDLLSNLSQGNAGTIVEQLPRSDAEGAKAMAKTLFRGKPERKQIAAFEMKTVRQVKGLTLTIKAS